MTSNETAKIEFPHPPPSSLNGITPDSQDTSRSTYIPIPDSDGTIPVIRGTEQKPYTNDYGVELEWRTTDVTMKKTGPRVRLARYDRTIEVFTKRKNCRRRFYDRDNTKREDNLKRASVRVLDLVMTNWPLKPKKYQVPTFITLTYRGEFTQLAQPENRKIHLQHQQDFMRKLRKQYGNNIRAISVMELQMKHKRRAVHIHMIVFNLPYNDMRTLTNMWPYGIQTDKGNTGVHIRRCKVGRRSADEESRNIANYVKKNITGYMSKDLEQVAGFYEKTYLPSHGLIQPFTVSSPENILALMNQFVDGEGYSFVGVSEPKYVPHFDAWVKYETWEPT